MAFPKIEGYVVTEKLGSGSYSIVYKAFTKVGARSVVAIKCVDKSRIKHSGSAVDNLITEIRMLKTLKHQHIVDMKDFTWDSKNIYIITEYCCGGDLSRYIKRNGRIPEHQVLYFLQQLASALKFMWEKGVVHMDLKPHNLLLNKTANGKYILKVADFGFAAHMSTSLDGRARGSPLYMAPEMFNMAAGSDVRSDKADLWSVGVIMYECLFGHAPYSSSTFNELVLKIQNKVPITLPPNSRISPPCRELLLSLLQHDVERRISYEEFFNNSYLDLEHMPSAENYDKAIAKLQVATKADSSGDFALALEYYKSALLVLVPAMRAEPGAARRHALQQYVESYMRRAEQLKELLKNRSDTARDPNQPPRATGHVPTCSHNDDPQAQTYSNYLVMRDTPQISGAGQSGTSNVIPDAFVANPPKPVSPVASRSKSRGSELTRRLFGRRTLSVDAPLDTHSDKKRSQDSPQTLEDLQIGETNNDLCKIT